VALTTFQSSSEAGRQGLLIAVKSVSSPIKHMYPLEMAAAPSFRTRLFRDVREAPMLLLLVVLLVDLLLNRLYILLLHYPLDTLQDVTGGLIGPLVSLSFIKIAFIAIGLILWIGHFKPSELGLWILNVPTGLLATVFLWAFLQLSMMIAGLLSEGFVRFSSAMEGLEPLRGIGLLALYAVTKALFDEIVYRGLLIPQLHSKLQRFIPLNAGMNLVLAVVISQLIYIIIQIPLMDFREGNEYHLTSAILSVVALSTLNSLIFLRTKNLYIAVGVHALWFNVTLFTETDFPPTIALAALVILFIVIYPMFPDRRTLLYAQPLEDRSLY
jgi:membrane protease YdiL (CAAX protease family)